MELNPPEPPVRAPHMQRADAEGPPPGPPPGPPAPPGEPEPDPKSGWSGLANLALEAVPAIAGAIGFVGFIAVIGGAIQWTRFWAADLPADQAVRVMPETELVTVGAVSTVVFTICGFAAVLLVYFLDSQGEASARTRAGLLILATAEIVAAGTLIELNALEYLLLGAWATALVAFGYRPLERGLRRLGRFVGRGSKQVDARERVQTAEGALQEAKDRWSVLTNDDSPRPAEDIEAAAVTLARARDEVELARLRLQRATGASDEAPAHRKQATSRPRGALAIALLVGGVVVFSVYDETEWLVRVLPVPIVLFVVLLGIARATRGFVWYGLAVFLSVPFFGGVLSVADIARTPQVQPIALVRKSDDRALCGIYVTQTEDRLYVGRVEPKPGSDRTENETGRIFSIPMDDVELASVGTLQNVHEAEARAIALLAEVYEDRAEELPTAVKNRVQTEVERKKQTGVDAKGTETETTTTTTQEEPETAGRPTRRDPPPDHPPDRCNTAELDEVLD